MGFGDIETSEATRTFNTVYMLAAVGSVAYGLGKLVEVLCNIGKVRRIERFCARGVTTELIAEIDVGGDGAVSRLEFASYMLVATGKLNQGDLNEVMALFDQYDLDGSGSIDHCPLLSLRTCCFLRRHWVCRRLDLPWPPNALALFSVLPRRRPRYRGPTAADTMQ